MINISTIGFGPSCVGGGGGVGMRGGARTWTSLSLSLFGASSEERVITLSVGVEVVVEMGWNEERARVMRGGGGTYDVACRA